VQQYAILIGLLIAAIPLVALARRLGVPYPIVLTIGGLVLGFVPGLELTLDPQAVLLLALPPLLYWESVTAPTDDIRANGAWVWPLAIGLVLATTAVVAVVMRGAVPHLTWAAAFVLGAVVAPTDEIAAVPIAERLGVPRHVVSIIDGEALLNDAVSLIIYTSAVAAVVTGSFSLPLASAQLVGAALGALAIGLIVGRLAVAAWRRFRDIELQLLVSVLLPFVAYAPANALHLSGVLAVVTAGVYVNRWTPIVLRPSTRLQAIGWWNTSVFLVNVVLFTVLGMQLHGIVTRALIDHSWTELLLDALILNVTIIVVRFGWVGVQRSLPWVRTPAHAGTDWKHGVVIALSGLRGTISLAAALGIPVTIATQALFPERDLIVFLTFTVILVTLVGGGLVLPLTIRALRLPARVDEEGAELRLAMRATLDAALRTLDEAEQSGEIGHEDARLLRRRYRRRLSRFDEKGTVDARRLRAFAETQRRVLDAELAALVALRRAGRIDNTVLRQVQTTLDLRQAQVDRIGDALPDAEDDVSSARGPTEGR
jgi:CPA1 family monovalent cation:H+ antiporter